jgi:hypothetical protein
LKEGNVPATLGISEAFSHRIAKWLFLSPVFAKTTRPLKLLPISIAMLIIGAFGSALARLDPALFFYLKDTIYSFTGVMILYVLNWIGLFLFAEVFTYLLYRRVGNSLQLLTCIGIATLPLMVFPYIYWIAPALFTNLSLADLDLALQGILIALQIWSILLVSSAFCFGKGLRLDKAIVVSLTAIYINMAVLFIMGRFA